MQVEASLENKIFNIGDALKTFSGDPCKIERYELLQRLREIPVEYAREYADNMMVFLEDIVKLASIIRMHEEPYLAKNLVEGLSDTLVERLNDLVVNLIKYQGEKEMQAIINATYGTVPPTDRTVNKARKFLDVARDIHGKKEQIVSDARYMESLAMIMGAFDVCSEKSFLKKLATFSEEDLDNLRRVAAKYEN